MNFGGERSHALRWLFQASGAGSPRSWPFAGGLCLLGLPPIFGIRNAEGQRVSEQHVLPESGAAAATTPRLAPRRLGHPCALRGRTKFASGICFRGKRSNPACVGIPRQCQWSRSNPRARGDRAFAKPQPREEHRGDPRRTEISNAHRTIACNEKLGQLLVWKSDSRERPSPARGERPPNRRADSGEVGEFD
jgi:hypothetical protein